MRYFILIISLIILGCSITPLTEEEKERREYNHVIDRENWRVCNQILKQFSLTTMAVHKHAHNDRHPEKDRPWMIQQDLSNFRCRTLLGERWAEHWTKDKKEKVVYASPMPELDSVDDVLLTPEEEARAIEKARETEKITKPPSRPKD